jgi:hypothetical protein
LKASSVQELYAQVWQNFSVFSVALFCVLVTIKNILEKSAASTVEKSIVKHYSSSAMCHPGAQQSFSVTSNLEIFQKILL